ncbi:hypothetical protein [Acidovorax sp. NCPPB 4044]|uniref:hypothetical protein n=1 Tax=Acidovorax sp. NCPPB 4044 TaxID=2940490 RepID=UPI002304A3A6|nr:hypothetical protein [Acidovorax sp. NCPPB 4044]MDA8522170.1 hypothetical protein [Acidovorax sp. NCPPB 4044]
MKISVFFTLIFFISFNLKAAEIRDDIDCAAIFSEDHIFARFPLIKKRNIWQWYVIERTPSRPEYAWIAETGKYHNGIFKADGFAFSLLIGSADLEKTPPKNGNSTDLINATKKNAFFTKSSPHYNNEELKEKLTHSSIIKAKIVEDDAIMAMTVDKPTTDEGKRGKATHIKLTAILPESTESYICIPKIEYIKMKKSPKSR